ncbi:MAG: glutamate-5-semialdehyde dehydrogenase [Candidatus Theseobacter exili]|nr:glutamate-5-semialdehyde dehydrogenase [Candidatus Theseobacter exili]
MDLKQIMKMLGKNARKAAEDAANLGTAIKNKCLEDMANEIEAASKDIEIANQEDLKNGRKLNLSSAMLDRLELTQKRMKAMVEGLKEVAALQDPVGEEIRFWTRPNGLRISKVRVPIGVIGIIFESRPNVTADAASLCFKSGNAVILRGGKEAIETNQAISSVLRRALEKNCVNSDIIQLIQTTDREAVKIMLGMNEHIDLIIPRGGEGLIRAVTEMSKIPVIKHYKGVCHVYIDKMANIEMAKSILINAKVQRPSVCNAAETLLVHQKIAKRILPILDESLRKNGVEIRGCSETIKILPLSKEAIEDDWSEEYLDLVLSVKVVKDIEDAIQHISRYGSAHSDCIVTDDLKAAEIFVKKVDSSAVFHNASTRFNDGFQFGLGAEIGISTDRLHARGPMGLEELNTYKYVVRGEGQVRD